MKPNGSFPPPQVVMTNASLNYGFEYLGNAGKRQRKSAIRPRRTFVAQSDPLLPVGRDGEGADDYNGITMYRQK